MFQVTIIEDDPFSQEVLVDLINDLETNYKVNGRCDSVEASLKFLETNNPDLVLLDMELLDGRGFEILEKLEQFNFEVIITTMHDGFMIEAIRHSAIDYLMKPISKEKLAEALKRFEVKIQKIKDYQNNSSKNKKNRLVIPNSSGLIILEIKDIIRLESDGSYTKIFDVWGKSHMVSKNLGYYETLLNENDFFRSHHKHLINLNQIKAFSKNEGGAVEMSDDSKIQVSRRRKEEFLKHLGSK